MTSIRQAHTDEIFEAISQSEALNSIADKRGEILQFLELAGIKPSVIREVMAALPDEAELLKTFSRIIELVCTGVQSVADALGIPLSGQPSRVQCSVARERLGELCCSLA